MLRNSLPDEAVVPLACLRLRYPPTARVFAVAKLNASCDVCLYVFPRHFHPHFPNSVRKVSRFLREPGRERTAVQKHHGRLEPLPYETVCPQAHVMDEDDE